MGRAKEAQSRVHAWIEQEALIQAGDVVIAGVSGGSDSMAMLSLLRSYQAICSFYLRVVHVHHGLRGEAADGDASLVQMLCKDWQMACRVDRYDVPYLASKEGLGTEEAGRMARRASYREEAVRAKAEIPGARIRIALAHHREDRCETLLWNLVRGCGLTGLAAMRSHEAMGDEEETFRLCKGEPPEIIRPLLPLGKEEILAYLEEEGLAYREDETNGSDLYTRNRIRHRLLPELRELNPGAHQHIADTAERLEAVTDYLKIQGRELLLDSAHPGGFLLGEKIRLAHPAVQGEAVYQALKTAAGRERDLQAVHIRKVLELFSKENGKQVSLPYRLFAEKTEAGVYLGRCVPAAVEEEVPLRIPGRTVWGEGEFVCRLLPWDGGEIPQKKYTKWMDYGTITTELSVRSRRNGDRMTVGKNGMEKALNRILIDDKVPRYLRPTLPLIAAGSKILWLTGGRLSQSVRVSEKTRRVLEITYRSSEADG